MDFSEEFRSFVIQPAFVGEEIEENSSRTTAHYNLESPKQLEELRKLLLEELADSFSGKLNLDICTDEKTKSPKIIWSWVGLNENSTPEEIMESDATVAQELELLLLGYGILPKGKRHEGHRGYE